MKTRYFAIGLDFALRAAAALLLASPVVAAVASTGISRFPEGDRLLFTPGGLLLVEVVRALWASLAALIRAELIGGLLLAIALVVPYSLLLVALSRRPTSAAELWGAALTRVPSLLALSGLGMLAQAATVLAMSVLAFQLRGALVGATSRGADLACVAVLAVGALVVLALAALRDLAGAACVRDTVESRHALERGFGAFVAAPLAVLGAWLLPAGLGLALVAAGAWLTAALDVAQPGAFRVALVFVVHQLVLVGRSFCRARWLGSALGFVQRSEPAAPQREHAV